MSALQLLKVHHATPDGLLFQLGEEKGFGRLGKEDMTAGGSSGSGSSNDNKDSAALGEKIMGLLSNTTAPVPVVVTEGRDSSGYLKVSTDIADVSSGIWTLPPSSSSLIRTLFKKTMVCPIGRSASVTVSKVSKAGTLVTLPSSILGAVIDTQALEAGTAEGDVINVFGLDLDSNKGISIVAAGLPVEELEESAGPLPPMGSKAECTVLYSNSEMLCVLARPLPGGVGVATNTEEECRSCIGFIALDQGATHKGEKLPTAAGSKLICNVLFRPGDWLSRYCPFVLLTTSSRARPDRCRLDIPSSGPNGVAVTYPWRSGMNGGQSRRQLEGEEPESRMKRRRMEEMIDEYERDPHHIPSSPDEFKKQLLGNPNSSFLWTQFIAYYLGLNQIEKARQTAEDALKTIGVRETNELFNIWVSYLNLENLNGTPESLNAVFKRSLQYADHPEKLYLALADIYENSGKNAALLDHCRMMSSKYCGNMKVWVRYGCVLAKQQKRDNLKRLLREMNQTLNKADQVEVVKSIAIFDFKNNSLETGRALLEGLLGKVPKRSDIWQVYLDQECAAIVRGHAKSSVDAARTLFERISTLSLPPRAMQLHLTRYLDFEKTHGTPESVETIKQKARAYVESKMKDMGSGSTGGAITS